VLDLLDHFRRSLRQWPPLWRSKRPRIGRADSSRRCATAAQAGWRYRGSGVAMLLLLHSMLVWAQSEPAASAPSPGDFNDEPLVSLAIVPFIAWASSVVGVTAGALTFAYRRRYGLVYPTAIAATAAVVVAVLTQYAVGTAWLNGEQKDCRSAEFGAVNTSSAAINCGSARESGANAFGTVALYLWAVDGGAERNRPAPAQVLTLIESSSLALATLAGCALLWLFIRKRF
jgi:hypothetical protein